jgi:hypothetical protein
MHSDHLSRFEQFHLRFLYTGRFVKQISFSMPAVESSGKFPIRLPLSSLRSLKIVAYYWMAQFVSNSSSRSYELPLFFFVMRGESLSHSCCNSMGLSSPSEDDIHSADQEIPWLLWNPKVGHSLQNNWPLHRIVRLLNPVHNLSSYFFFFF